MVGKTRTSNSANTYCLVNFKVADNEFLLIRVMFPQNEEMLKAPRGTALKLFSLARKGDTIFYNRRFGAWVELLNTTSHLIPN